MSEPEVLEITQHWVDGVITYTCKDFPPKIRIDAFTLNMNELNPALALRSGNQFWIHCANGFAIYELEEADWCPSYIGTRVSFGYV